MPTSPSPRRVSSVAPRAGTAPRSQRPPPAGSAPPRPLWRYGALFLLLAVIAVAVMALPASLAAHFLPAGIQAEDFSGSLWHGSAGRIALNSRDLGALEWRLHPAALLGLQMSADLHWVKGGFVLDGAAIVDRRSIAAANVAGGGPIGDLAALGVVQGFSGTATVQIKQLTFAWSGSAVDIKSAVGDVAVSDIAVPQLASGADLGSYVLHFADPTVTPDTDLTAQLNDTGGPLSLDATVHYIGRDRRGVLSGTLKERADIPAALRNQLQALTQMHARDAEGRIPVDLEFTL